MALSLLTLTLLVFTALRAVLASSCIAFDITNNLLVFGLGDKDFSLGTQDTWTTALSAVDITKAGRPPFNGPNTTCYLAQFFNAIYVMGADISNPSAIYIYDATTKSWSMQTVNTGSFDPTSSVAILDHDTNVFYAMSEGELYSLDMASLTAANSMTLSWVDVQKPPFPDNYQPVMALAQNHIHFLNIPGLPAGTAEIFVIHYSYFQPQPQAYPASSGNTFPSTHGQTASFFRSDNTVQQEFAFIPDDGSATYIINVENNSTNTLPGPTTKDPKATYFAGVTSLVQLDAAGVVSFIPYMPGNVSGNSGWTAITSLPTPPPVAISQNETQNNGSQNNGPQNSGTQNNGTQNNGTSPEVAQGNDGVLGWKIGGIATALSLAAAISLLV
jgi:hypothetical protein